MATDVPLHEQAKRRRLEDGSDDVTEPEEEAYSCSSCLLGAKIQTLYHGVQLMSDSFFNYLLSSINDATSAQRTQLMGKVVVPVQVDCENCREEIQVKAGITATPVWDLPDEDNVDSTDEATDSDTNPNSARISHFQNITVVDILPAETEQDTSLSVRFFRQPADVEPDWLLDFGGVDCMWLRPVPQEESNLRTLVVLARVPMKGGSSYFAYDPIERHIVRLVFQENGECSFVCGENLSVGGRYKFTMLRHPQYQKDKPAPSLLPHRNSDLVVNRDIRYLPYPKPVDLYDLLKGHAHRGIREIFSQGHIYDRKYIWANRNCPAVGALCCKDFNAQLCPVENGPSRIKLYLEEFWDLPVTGFDCEKCKDKGREILLVLALSAPWDNKGLFKPARCYLMCVAIIYGPGKQ